ncbi:UPF0481 protein At3g47200-like isoform X2 [Pistacia vera]|nr:UPF0481 protein At3g47200-like isoform X2 [Pistacia vera]XP_031251241.1 UPF0481 protein At3g47200-like isoform X2 [Pistacia vera]
MEVEDPGSELEASEQMERRDDYAVIDMEDPYSKLETSLMKELGSFNDLFEECNICRVQESVRELDEEAYTPQIVSIGPIHHGKLELKVIEDYKRRFYKSFFERSNRVRLKDFIEVIKENMCDCYANTIEMDSDDFVKMILMDVVFILEVPLTHIEEEHFIYDSVFRPPSNIYDVANDLFLLDNQLPFFILKDLFRLADVDISFNNQEKSSILQIVHGFTRWYWGYLGIEKNFD